MPDVGNRVKTSEGEGRVVSINMISEKVMVEYPDATRRHHRSEIIKILDRKSQRDNEYLPQDTLKKLVD